MSTGKRRTNWETVLEARIGEEREVLEKLIKDGVDTSVRTSITLDKNRLNQITDLQNEFNALHKKSVRYGCILAIIASIGLLTAVLK